MVKICCLDVGLLFGLIGCLVGWLVLCVGGSIGKSGWISSLVYRLLGCIGSLVGYLYGNLGSNWTLVCRVLQRKGN